MNKKYKFVFFSICFIFILNVFFHCNLPYKLLSVLTSKSITVTATEYYANCSITGSESSLTVKATATENTSGIDDWSCRKYGTSTWVTCPQSSFCKAYSLTGWNGYDAIKTADLAGNESNVSTLYINDYENEYGEPSTSSTITLNTGSNAIHIISTEADSGTISSVSISSNGRIKITGTPEVKTRQKENTTTHPVYSITLCPAGKPVERNGSYYCEASSYRLQNDTCVCDLKKNSSGKWEFNTSSGWKKEYICVRSQTYCSDEYDDYTSVDSLYDIVTKRTKNSQNCSDGAACSNSNMYSRDLNSLCFTYYKTDGNGSTYGGIFSNDWYENYSFFSSKITGYGTNTLPAKSSLRKLMVAESESTSTICNGSNTGTTSGTNYYSSHSGVTYDGVEGICNYLMDKLNAGATDIHGVSDSNSMMIPIISSATCYFNGARANSVGYSETAADLSNNTLYYCKTGKIESTTYGYTCKQTTYYDEYYYYYDWYVYYLRK